MKKFRIKNKVYFRDDTTPEGYPIITRIVRPEIQMKILFFWVRVKTFLYYTSTEAKEACNKMFNQLTSRK